MRRPRWLYTWPLRLRSLLRARTVDAELDEELRYHLETDAAALAARGLSAADAETAARRKFGGVAQQREECRDTRGLAALESLQQDLRYGARMLRRSPGFTLVAAATLAIGIGANTAIFSLVDGILFRPLPFPAPERLVMVTGTYPRGAFAAMREQVKSAEVGAYVADQSFMLTGLGDAVRLNGAAVSADLFAILGARAATGRSFRSDEDLAGNDQVVILSHALWQQRFGSDANIVGRSIALEGVRRVVVGVMPASFTFPSRAAQLWVPLHLDPRNTVHYWAGDFMPVVGRLRQGETLEATLAEVKLFQSHVGALFPWKMPTQWNKDVNVIPLQSGMVANVETRLLILLGAVALVLLIACANVANLTLSRAAGREREIGVRAALGAAPRRIARQMLTESVLLSLLGGLAGLLVAAQALAILKLALPADTPRLEHVHMNWRVLLFTAGVSIATGCLFGLAPVFHARRAALVRSMESGGRGAATGVSERLRSALAIAEVAMAVLLVASAGLLVRSLWTLAHVDPGFRAEQVVTARITPGASVCGDVTRCLAFYRALEDQVRASPGVNDAAFINTLPLGGSVSKRSLQLEGVPITSTDTAPLFWLKVVTPDYFRVMGIRLESGRAFVDADRPGNPAVAIVTADTARRYWPGQSALGKHVRFAGEQIAREVVGVVADVRAYDLTHNVPSWITGMIYVPHGPRATLENQQPPTEMTLTVRTTSPDGQVGSLVRRLVADATPEAAVSDVRAMSSVVSDAVSTPASTASLFVSFAGVALLLGSIGVYGVLSFLVSRRTRDIGIRLALGAQRRDVSWLVLREGVWFAGLGIGLGLAAAFALTRLLTSELHGVSALDPLTYVGVTLVVSMVSLTASYLPARRATRVNPLVALRDG